MHVVAGNDSQGSVGGARATYSNLPPNTYNCTIVIDP
jgi:hypothetical protein